MDVIVLAIAGLVAAAALLWLARRMVAPRIVYPWEAGLLYVNGQFQRTLGAGRHWLWRVFDHVELHKVRVQDQWIKVGPVDVASAEKLPFRLSALILYNVSNPRDFHERQGELLLRQTVSAALVELAGARSLESLVANRAEASQALLALAAATAGDCEIVRCFVDAVQLPPESRRLFIEIEKARLEGLASLERARGEQATLRSLANAARLLKNNPDLMNLRLLQAVSASQKGQMTVVLGQKAPLGGSEAEKLAG